MVKKYDKNGEVYIDAPYTKEEEFEIYRRMDGGIKAFTRPTSPSSEQEPQPQHQPKPAKPPRA
jgi:hypothetical protein